jgi:hypothetical protein
MISSKISVAKTGVTIDSDIELEGEKDLLFNWIAKNSQV